MRLGRLILFILCTHVISTCNLAGADLSAPNLARKTFPAKVVRILDGDTMEVLYDNRDRIKIRLAHIDCPEKRSSQPFANRAKQALSNLCFGQYVTVHSDKYDRFGRLIAVLVNGSKQIVNQEMVRQGMAWHFKRYSKDSVYAKLEQEARLNRVGLWHDHNPIAPWKWRKPKTVVGNPN
ncbi:MAG: thermonuclease family protein [Pseudosphingobacterium sp.]|nr:thermonuclease family protein [Pseudosphingobacterium sp.]